MLLERIHIGKVAFVPTVESFLEASNTYLQIKKKRGKLMMCKFKLALSNNSKDLFALSVPLSPNGCGEVNSGHQTQVADRSFDER
jgi:hypothetical protein